MFLFCIFFATESNAVRDVNEERVERVVECTERVELMLMLGRALKVHDRTKKNPSLCLLKGVIANVLLAVDNFLKAQSKDKELAALEEPIFKCIEYVDQIIRFLGQFDPLSCCLSGKSNFSTPLRCRSTYYDVLVRHRGSTTCTCLIVVVWCDRVLDHLANYQQVLHEQFCTVQ